MEKIICGNDFILFSWYLELGAGKCCKSHGSGVIRNSNFDLEMIVLGSRIYK